MSTNIFRNLEESPLKTSKEKGKEPARVIPKPVASSKNSSMRVRTRSTVRLNPLLGKDMAAATTNKIRKSKTTVEKVLQEAPEAMETEETEETMLPPTKELAEEKQVENSETTIVPENEKEEFQERQSLSQRNYPEDRDSKAKLQ